MPLPRYVIPALSAALRQNGSRTLAVALALACATSAARAQASLGSSQAIGEWRAYNAYQEGRRVAGCEDFAAWLTAGGTGLLLRFAETGELRRLDKANVLAQADPTLIRCNPFAPGQLLVGYADGAVEVLADGERSVAYARDIADAQLFGERDLTGFAFAGSEEAFVLAEFGFLRFDPARGLFLDDVRTSDPVRDVAAFGGDLYVATDAGLRVLPDYADAPRIRDFAQYVRADSLLPGRRNGGGLAVTHLETWRDELYVAYADTLVALGANGTVRLAHTAEGRRIRDLRGGPTYLLATEEASAKPGDRVAASRDGRDFAYVDVSCSGFGVLGAAEAAGEIAWAGQWVGLGFCRTPAPGEACVCSQVDSPNADQVFDVDARDGVVAAVSGGYSVTLQYTFNRAGAYVLAGDTWRNVNQRNTPALREGTQLGNPEPLADFVAVAIDADTALWMGAYFEGLARVLPDGSGEVFDERNSPLNPIDGDPGRVRVTALDLDAAGNLWVANYGGDPAVSVRTPDGTWYGLDVGGCSRGTFVDVDVDDRTGVAYLADAGFGVVAYDPGRGADGLPSFGDEADDVCTRVSSADGLPSVDAFAVAVDRDGIAWVGTADGIARVTCAGGDCTVSQPTAVVDGINGFLFDDQVVRSVAFDGGNRKWFGTDNGLFLLDAAAEEELAYYSEGNSPLLDDRINALAFDGTTGLLWVGTDAGLMSLRTESTTGRDFAHAAEVEVFPQPVRPDYEGPIAIRGLANDANVKITDAAGRLVYETEAAGGQAVWDGRDYTGHRPASGVYLVWATATRSQTQPATVVARIALLR